MKRSRKIAQMLPEFIAFLRSPEAFEDPDCGRMYDHGACAAVIGACLDIRHFGRANSAEEIAEGLEEQEKETLRQICQCPRLRDEIE